MLDALEEFIVGLLFAAHSRSQFEEIRHEDLEPARYLIFDQDTEKIVHVYTLERGQSVFVHRSRRLLIEPVYQVPMRHPMRYLQTWWVA